MGDNALRADADDARNRAAAARMQIEWEWEDAFNAYNQTIDLRELGNAATRNGLAGVEWGGK